jgi:hypothetical protein
MKVPLCFSAANIKMVKTSCAVKNISMKSPWTIVVFPPRVVRTFRSPGNMHWTKPAAAIPPRIWVINNKRPRTQGNAPIRHMPNVTCASDVSMLTSYRDRRIKSLTAGLNKPPLIRKNTHAFTASEKPKHSAMYCSCCGLLPASATVAPPDDGMLLATCVPDKAKYKKSTVPTNSPHMAIKWLRMLSGTRCMKGRRSSESVSSALGSAALVKGRAKARPWTGC